jgi:hypothetical protein
VELNTRQDSGYRVSLARDRDTGETRIVVADHPDAGRVVFDVPGADAGDPLRQPFTSPPRWSPW